MHHVPKLSVHPTAPALLDLAERKATGSFTLADRCLVIRQGAVAAVEAAAGDLSFESFLEQTGWLDAKRISRVRKQADEYGLTFEQAISKHHDLQAVLRTTRRAVWLDRLRRALRVSREMATDGTPFLPYAPQSPSSYRTSLVLLVLDALAAEAQMQDADEIGHHTNSCIQWLATPSSDLAKQWAQMEGVDSSVALIEALLQKPFLASRLAALVQAGQIALLPPSSYPIELASSSPAAINKALAMDATTENFHLGHMDSQAATSASPSDLTPSPVTQASSIGPHDDLLLHPIMLPTQDLTDPLEALERALSVATKSAEQRAALWCQAGEIWQERHASLSEAFRCYREAAAADPGNLAAGKAVVSLADVLGDDSLGLTYAKALVRHTASGHRREALRALANFALRIHALDAAREASDQLIRLPGVQAEDFELAARVLADVGTVDHVREFSDTVCAAAKHWLTSEPNRALAMLAWGFQLCPISERLTLEYSAHLCDHGFDDTVAVVGEWHQRALAEPALNGAPQSNDRSLSRMIFGPRVTYSTAEANERLEQLLQVRALFGETPAFLYAVADLASQTGRLEVMREVVDTWFWLTPFDSAAAVLRLIACCATDGNRTIAQTAVDVLSAPTLHPLALSSLKTALRQLAESSEPELAVQLAQNIVEQVGIHRIRRVGEHGILALITGLAYQHKAQRLLLLMHDQEAWNADAQSWQLHMQAITDLHRESHRLDGEVRSLLRRIARQQDDADAYTRLFDIYTSVGRAEQVKSMWIARLDRALNKHLRWRCLLDLAALAYFCDQDSASAFDRIREIATNRDPEGLFVAADAFVTLSQPHRAVELLLQAKADDDVFTAECHKKAAAIAELHIGDANLALDIVANGILTTGNSSLIPIFERMALSAGKVLQAKAIYDELATRAMGKHSRRSIHYRAARFFELAADPEQALQAYMLAFRQKPLNGVIFRAIQRLCEQTESKQTLLNALDMLADNSPNEQERKAVRAQLEQLTSQPPAARLRSVTPAYAERSGALLSDPSPEKPQRHITTIDQLDPLEPLLALLRADPSDVSTWRSVHRLGNATKPSVRRVAANIVRLFDPSVDHAEPPTNVDNEVDHDAINAILHTPADQQVMAVFERVWQGANPRFRKLLSQFGLRESDRLSPLEAPISLGRAYMHANRVLGTVYPALYSNHTNGEELVAIATNPPALMFGPQLDLAEDVLKFRLGCVLEQALPGNILLATLEPSEGEALVEGVIAAFGDTRQRPPSKRAALMGAELWEIMPKKDQDWIRKQVATFSDIPGYDTIKERALASAAKAGLLACGNLFTAVSNLHRVDASLRNVDLHTESAFAAACRNSPLLRELLLLSISEPYLVLQGV